MNFRLLLLFITIFFTTSVSFSETMKVMTLNEISTLQKAPILELLVTEDFYLAKDFKATEGSIIIGEMVDITPPKRLKRNASFKFLPHIIIAPDKKRYFIKYNFPAKYYKPLDINIKKLGKSGAISIATHIIPFFNYTFYAIEGAKNNKYGGKLKSSFVNIYKNSVFSNIEKGKELKIPQYHLFYLKFKQVNEKSPYYQDLLVEISNSNKSVPQIIDEYEKELQANYPYKHQIRDRIKYLRFTKD